MSQFLIPVGLTDGGIRFRVIMLMKWNLVVGSDEMVDLRS